MFFKKSEVPKDYVTEKHESNSHDERLPVCPCHSWQRKAALIHAGPVNHKKNVFFAKDDSFDLNRTIFASVSGLLGARRALMVSRLGNEAFWKKEEAEAIDSEFEGFEEKLKVIKSPAPYYDNYADLMSFMETDCNFKTEHADGSFMDHLYFCRDYSKAYYSAESPRILFLHSIMGVGSNVFPMEANKIDKLKSLLDEREFLHIAAFPSILRLLFIGDISKELLANAAAFKKGEKKIKNVEFHRVLDNEKIVLTGDELMSALNIQLIHQMDFLPSTNWSTQIHDPLFQMFVEIFQLLKTLDKIDAKVEFSIDQVRNISEKDEFGMPQSIATLLSKVTPSWVKRQQLTKSIQTYSSAIGHTHTYKIQYEDNSHL